MTEHHSEPNAAVEAFDITRTYGVGDTAVEALRGVSLTIPTGQFTAVMGPSGSGKSTLMHILAGLDLPTTGTVIHRRQRHHHDVSDTQLTQLRRDHIGFIFQFFNLLPMLTAEENILLPLRLAGEKVDDDLGERDHRQGRARRPPQAPAVRALRRPAAARRDRPRAGVAADRDVRRRADRQPRLGRPAREILNAAARAW